MTLDGFDHQLSLLEVPVSLPAVDTLHVAPTSSSYPSPMGTTPFVIAGGCRDSVWPLATLVIDNIMGTRDRKSFASFLEHREER